MAVCDSENCTCIVVEQVIQVQFLLSQTATAPAPPLYRCNSHYHRLPQHLLHHSEAVCGSKSCTCIEVEQVLRQSVVVRVAPV